MDYTLAITILYVQDIEQERRFYHEVLGLPIDEAQSSPDFVMLKPAGPNLVGLAERVNGDRKGSTGGRHDDRLAGG